MSIDEQYDKLYRYCFFKLHNRDLAEDVTQETFLHYLERYGNLPEEAALKCLYTIARNLCVDEYRRGKREMTDELPPEEAEEYDTLTRIAVCAALEKLEESERELLLLRYVNELSVSTIGAILGISRFAAYRKVTSASKKFQAELKKEDIYE